MPKKVDSSGTWNYEWDYENRLKKVTKPDNSYVEYEYDSLGRRTKRSLSTGTWTKFTYDGLYQYKLKRCVIAEARTQ